MSDTTSASSGGTQSTHDAQAERGVIVASGSIEFIAKQPAKESLARVFLGSAVHNANGETIGDIHDVMFDETGHITSVLLGVGGFIGLGEKIVAIPFKDISIAAPENAARMLTVHVEKRALEAAPAFVAVEKTTLDSVSDLAVVLGQKAAHKAGQIKDQVVKTVGDLRK